MLREQILKQPRGQSTRAIRVEDFANLQLREETEKSKSKRFKNEMKIFKLFLNFFCLTENTF